MTARQLFVSALLVCPAALPASAQDASSFSGFVTSAAGHTPLEVDGRPLLLSKGTTYACNSTVPSVIIENGIPDLPRGAEVEVTGKWNRKAGTWRTDVLCTVGLPPKSIHGQGSIDAVEGSVISVDGRRLRLASPAALTMTPPLGASSAPVAGQWMQYAADRQPDGSWVLRSATVREYLDNRAARSERKWKPFAFTPPAGVKEGIFKVARFTPPIKLPADPALQERVAHVGATVVPGWEKALGALYPDEVKPRFYAAKLHDADCRSFPNGMILVPDTTAKALASDAELAAVLAGCVAELEEEQAAVYANKQLAANSIEAANYLEIAIPAGFIAGSAYQHHLRQLMEEQSARIALTYLQAEGYPISAGPATWEKLEGKHGQADLSRAPGTRASMMWKAFAQSSLESSGSPAQAGASRASMVK